MRNKILVIDGHPDPERQRFCHALADTYIDGARSSGLETRLITVADADFTLLRTAREFAEPPTQRDIIRARQDLLWCNHLVLIFPLWLGDAPALLRGFLEHMARASFIAETDGRGIRQKLRGRSARLIVTMGMPKFAYSLIFQEHGVQNIMHGVLGFGGISPIRRTYFGGVDSAVSDNTLSALNRVRALGRDGA